MHKTKLVLASLFLGSTLSAEPLGQGMPNGPACGMPLPPVKLLKTFVGPSNGPFILPKGNKNTVTLLSMNIQNLPFTSALSHISNINPDYRADRMDCIAKLTAQFDAAAFQEDFIDRKYNWQNSWKPHFTPDWFKFGRPGLSFQSKMPFEKIEAQPFTTCSGTLGQANDCLTTKGYQHVRLGALALFNIHTDAAFEDATIRSIQTDEIIKAIPQTGPVMLVADMNYYFASEIDKNSLNRLLQQTRMKLYMRYSPDKGHDIVAARGVDVETIGAIENLLLSDHAGLIVKFKLPVQIQSSSSLQLARN